MRWEDERETIFFPGRDAAIATWGATLTIVWFSIVWFVADLIGDAEPLPLRPGEHLGRDADLAAALDLNRSIMTSRRSR
jgi:hypothetical protein